MTPKADRKLLVTEAAEAARVTERTIWNWIRLEKVKTIRTVGGSIRIYESSLFLATSTKKD